VKLFLLLNLLVTLLFPSVALGDPPVYLAQEKGVYFREWLLCGPFPNAAPGVDPYDVPHGENCVGFHGDLLAELGGEAAVDPKEGDPAPDSLTWKRYTSDSDLVSFEKAFGPHDQVVAYAFLHLDSNREERAILSVGSNDGIKVFLNRELVHAHHVPRWLEKDSDYVPISLKKGINRLLLKVDESTGDWGLCARLLDYEETIAALEENLESHKKFSVVTRNENLVALFGEPYKIVTLNPGAKVSVKAFDSQKELVAQLSGPPGFEIPFPISSFDDGPVRFAASFPISSTKTVTSQRGHYVGVLPRHELPATIREDLAFVRDGKPYFPIGTYGAQPSDYPYLKECGYDFVVGGADHLDAAEEAGLLVAIGFHGDDEAYLKHLEETIQEYKDHPAVLCWMLADEPGYNRMDLLNMHRAYELVHRIDPIHPSYLVITNRAFYETFGRCCDVLAIDTYPISKKFPINDVGDNIARAYRVLEKDLPIWHCGQTFNWPADRLPTPAEHRYMTYQAAFEGVKGMLWFTYRWQGESLPEADPELWEEHLRLIRELRELEPYLLSEGLGEEMEVQTDGGSVRAKVRTAPNGSRSVIALNRSREESKTARIQIPGLSQADVEVLGEGRKVDSPQGWIKDTFEPLGVHVYLEK
jgi:hypothetical protein